MKALILVGGEATRLRPLTCHIPKAMVPVLNLPFLEHVIRNLHQHQIRDIILALHHLAEPVEQYLGDGSQYGVKLSYIIEESALGTAGAIKNAGRYFNDTFLALNGDIFTDLDFTALIAYHRAKNAMATITLTPVEDPTIYGVVEADNSGRVTRFLEKPASEEVTTNMINAGTYVLEAGVLAKIPPRTRVSIERETFPRLLEENAPVYAYPSDCYWIDTGTPEKYLQLHRDLLSGKCRHTVFDGGRGKVIGAGTSIHPTARIEGKVVIGDNCIIGEQVRLTGPVVIGDVCRIDEKAVIEGSVIWQGVNLGPGVHLKDTVVADGCFLNSGSFCDNAVIGKNVTIASGYTLGAGSKIWPDISLE